MKRIASVLLGASLLLGGIAVLGHAEEKQDPPKQEKKGDKRNEKKGDKAQHKGGKRKAEQPKAQ